MTANQFLSGTVSTDATGTYTSAIIPTIGYAGMVITTGAWPLAAGTRHRVILEWFSDPLGANQLASKQYASACVTTGAGGLAIPHAGDYVRVTIVRSIAAVVSFTITAEHRDSPMLFWIPQQASPESFRLPFVVPTQTVNVPATSTVSVGGFNSAFEGPGVLIVHGPTAVANGDWNATVFMEDEAGTFRFHLADAAAVLNAQPQWATVPFIIAPGLITVDLLNNTAAAKNITVTVVADWSRAAA